MGGDSATLMSNNHYVSLIANMHFKSAVGNSFSSCIKAIDIAGLAINPVRGFRF
jgi:hypothetical protein